MNYLLREVPGDLWKRVRAKAAREGRSVRFILIEFLRAWVKEGAR